MGKRVLIVEDDRDISGLLEVALKGEGHQVAVAVSVEEAIRVCGSLNPDVITLDIGLPRGREGLGLVEWCAAREEPRPKIIVLSALGRQALDEVRDDPRVSVVMPKPFDVVELLALIEGAAGGSDS